MHTYQPTIGGLLFPIVFARPGQELPEESRRFMEQAMARRGEWQKKIDEQIEAKEERR